MDQIADAEKVIIEKCKNGWVVSLFLENEAEPEKHVFEYFDSDHDDQLPALVDLLRMTAQRVGPFPGGIGHTPAKSIGIDIIDRPPDTTTTEENKSE